MSELRHVNAAATIIHHQGRILVVLKEGWDQFCVTVTKVDVEAGECGSAGSARDFEKVLGSTPPCGRHLLLDESFAETSLRLGETAHYDFQIYSSELPALSPAADRAGRWLTAEEILDSATEDISPTARRLIRRLSEAALDNGRAFPPTEAPPHRKSTASVAIIRREGRTGPEWLAQYNDRWGRYFLVGGHEEPGETSPQCLQRELHEELHITPDDFTASSLQLLNFTAWSTGSWQLTDYAITAFSVAMTDAAVRRVSSQSVNRWLTATEINSERCTDGKLISPTMRRVLLETGDIESA